MIGVGFAVASLLGTAGQVASGVMSAQARQGEFAEQLRRLDMKKRYTVGLTAARAGASGTEFASTSTQSYLASLTSEFDRAIAATRKAKSLAGLTDTLGLIAGGISGIAGAAGTLGKANNWWQTPATEAGNTYTPGSGMPLWR